MLLEPVLPAHACVRQAFNTVTTCRNKHASAQMSACAADHWKHDEDATVPRVVCTHAKDIALQGLPEQQRASFLR